MPLPKFAIEAKKDVRGLCEVVINVDEELLPLYVQKEKELLIAGDLFQNKKHMTGETLEALHAAKFQKAATDIDDAVAFTYTPKESSGHIYFFTDPDCTYCEKAKAPLKSWAEKNKIEVRVIMFPLAMHPGANAKAVSAICAHISYEAYLENKYGTDACNSGRERVSKALAIGRSLGVDGTPTFVGPTGRTSEGFNPDELKGIL